MAVSPTASDGYPNTVYVVSCHASIIYVDLPRAITSVKYPLNLMLVQKRQGKLYQALSSTMPCPLYPYGMFSSESLSTFVPDSQILYSSPSPTMLTHPSLSPVRKRLSFGSIKFVKFFLTLLCLLIIFQARFSF